MYCIKKQISRECVNFELHRYIAVTENPPRFQNMVFSMLNFRGLAIKIYTKMYYLQNIRCNKIKSFDEVFKCIVIVMRSQTQ